MSGRKKTGKTVLIELLIKQHFTDCDDVKIERIDGRDYTNAESCKLFERLGFSEIVEQHREAEKNDEAVDSRKRGTKCAGEKVCL